MLGEQLGADMHVASCDSAAVRNLMLAVERCHLEIEAVVASPYAAGLSVLVEDEADMGTAVIDMGGGTTSIAIFDEGRFTHADAVAVGGNHVTTDIARGLTLRLADAERIKTYYGSCIVSPSDERETISIAQVGMTTIIPRTCRSRSSFTSSSRASKKFSNSCASACIARVSRRSRACASC